MLFGIIWTSPSNFLESYFRTLVGRGSYSYAELQSEYFTAPADWACSKKSVRRWKIVIFSYAVSQQHNNKDVHKKTSLEKYCTSHFIVRVRKGLLNVCVWEGVGDRTETAIFWPPLLWPSALCLFRSPDAQPEAQRPTLLGDGFLYCILSATSLDPNSSGPQRPFGLKWLYLPHFAFYFSNSNCNSDFCLDWVI